MMPHHGRPLAHERNSIFKCKQHTCNEHVHSMIPEDQKNITTQWCSTGRLFTAATQALNRGLLKPGIGWDPVPGFSIWYFWIPGPGFWCYRDHWSNIFLASGYEIQRKDVCCFGWSYRLALEFLPELYMLYCYVIFHKNVL